MRKTTASERGTRRRRSTRRQARDDDEEDDGVRMPDQVVNTQVFVPEDMMTDDRELYETIRKSRDEYMKEQRRQQEDKAKFAKLRGDLALPMSRLKTWMEYTSQDQEKTLLRHLIILLETHLDHENDCHLDTTFTDPCLRSDMEVFLSQLSQSKLYHGLSQLCLELIH